jgi:ankyrin repeat protein
MLNLLLEAGGAHADLLDTSCWGQTALHDAAGQGHVECVRSLLPASANPNILNSHGHTPLSQAVGRDVFSVYDFVDAVRTVLRAAASASCKCSGLSPLLQATENQSYHIVWHLPEAAEDPNCSTGKHDTALHIAAREKYGCRN